jgi:DNA-binding MarR family transcriptional regulator
MGDTEDEVFQLDRSPSHLLHRAQQLAADLVAAHFDDNTVTLRQFVVLAAVAEGEGCTQSELVRTTGIDRSTLAEMVNRMEGRGLLSRTRAEGDARANAVHLAAPGRDLLAALSPRMQAADKALLSELSKGKRSTFVDILAGLADVVSDEPSEGQDKKKKKKKKKKKD